MAINALAPLRSEDSWAHYRRRFPRAVRIGAKTEGGMEDCLGTGEASVEYAHSSVRR